MEFIWDQDEVNMGDLTINNRAFSDLTSHNKDLTRCTGDTSWDI